ncbi:hypothetical protein MZM54_02000 [[Brevibacterium] frigoritolerans]|nr:hypothetical protein [Peribacillus frigoritolerans]
MKFFKNIFYWIENRFKRILYKKYLLEKDLTMAIQENSVERVKRMVPNHSLDIFMKELKKINPQLLK